MVDEPINHNDALLVWQISWKHSHVSLWVGIGPEAWVVYVMETACHLALSSTYYRFRSQEREKLCLVKLGHHRRMPRVDKKVVWQLVGHFYKIILDLAMQKRPSAIFQTLL